MTLDGLAQEHRLAGYGNARTLTRGEQAERAIRLAHAILEREKPIPHPAHVRNRKCLGCIISDIAAALGTATELADELWQQSEAAR